MYVHMKTDNLVLQHVPITEVRITAFFIYS